MVRGILVLVVSTVGLGGTAHGAMLSTQGMPVDEGQTASCTLTNVTSRDLQDVTFRLVDPHGFAAMTMTMTVPSGNTRNLDHAAPSEGAFWRCDFAFRSGRNGHNKVRAGMLVRDIRLKLIGSDTAR